jgi:hypothetical protein
MIEMGNLPKKYGKPRLPGQKTPGQKAPGRKNELQWSLAIAEVTRVDYENMVCDVQFLTGARPPGLEVPISAAYWSQRSFLGAMPEEGALAICGFMDAHQGQANSPLILSFLPNGYKTALRYHPLGPTGERDAPEVNIPKEAQLKDLEGLYDVTRYKMRKLYPGDIFGMSEQGSEILLNESAHLMNQQGSELLLRGSDNASILTSLDHYRTTAASRKRSGRIVRNKLNVPSDLTNGNGQVPENHPLFDHFLDLGLVFEDGTLVDDVNNLPASRMPGGDLQSVITPNQRDPNKPETDAFVEERMEIQETSDQRIPEGPEQGFDSDHLLNHFEPFIEKVSGTVVGNDAYSSKGRSRYGQLLRPSLFSSSQDTSGQPRMEVIPNEPSEREKNLAAAYLYRMRRPDGQGELFVSHDKEGHVFLSIPASTSKSSNLGAGRSVEADLKGSSKVTMGSNSQDNESMDLDAEGGFKWNLGTLGSSNRSLELKTRGGLSFDVRGSDVDGSAFNGKFTGNYGVSITGDKGESVSGTSIEEVGGKKRMASESYNQSVGTGNFSRTITSDKQETVSGKVDQSIGKGRKTTITKAGKGTQNAEELDIKSGNRETKFLAPAKDNIKFTSTGEHSIEATGPLRTSQSTPSAGQFSTSANTGVYSVSMNTGSIALNASAGVITLASGVTVSIQSSVISLTGSVGLGAGASAPNAVIGGVPGPSPHIDFITGLPLLGNPLVRTV